MRKGMWLWVAALAWLSGGCCNNPGVFQKVHYSMALVQSFYDPLIRQDLDCNDTAKQAVVAADTTLLLGGELQKQWCPNPGQASQLELQAQEAKQLAQAAGVAGGSATLDKISMKGSE